MDGPGIVRLTLDPKVEARHDMALLESDIVAPSLGQKADQCSCETNKTFQLLYDTLSTITE